MPRIFIGKIGSDYPQQIDENIYAGGTDTKRYGGLQPGDYVFPINKGQIRKLWRFENFSTGPNTINNRDGAAHFEEVKMYNPPILLTSQFILSPYFEVDIVLLNKASKQTSSVDFWPIVETSDCPQPEQIDFSTTRNYYIQLVGQGRLDLLKPKEKDIRVVVDENQNYKIIGIEEFKNGKFSTYAPLQNLYEAKNPTGKRYTLKELLEYAVEDHASNKENYLKKVIKELQQKSVFQAPSATGLYDNIIVGRRVTPHPNKPTVNMEEEEEMEEEETLSETEQEEYSVFESLLDFNPNLILYGPPGTGKTYTAQRVIEYLESKREKRNITFEQVQQNGRVEFVTFHQSYSYEDFIEGLRPQLATETEDQAQENSIKYVVNDGILKRLANKAALSQLKQDFKDKRELDIVGENNRTWKVSLGARYKEEHIYEDCIKNNFIAIGWLDGIDLAGYSYEQILEDLKNEKQGWTNNPTAAAGVIDAFLNEMQIGDIILVFDSVKTIRAIGVIEGEYYYDEETKNYPHKRKTKWLKVFSKPVDILKYNNNVWLTMKTIYELSRIKFSDIKEMLSLEDAPVTSLEVEARPYYLIIDEINRGNISKIFGELLTLLESDKRDRLKVKLPYSQKEFTVPRNLYVIGTMNTADRSIAVIDTALRRRFTFKELEPNADVIRNSDSPKIGNFDLAALMDKLNDKLLEYNDRDHRIGHSYFLQLLTVNDLKITWYYQIIPLLMEYFYNDGETIVNIISSRFIDKSTCNINWIENDQEFIKALESF